MSQRAIATSRLVMGLLMGSLLPLLLDALWSPWASFFDDTFSWASILLVFFGGWLLGEAHAFRKFRKAGIQEPQL